MGREEIERVRRAMSAMHHRGPDGEGEFTDSHVVLGMRRLSIIDLAGGWQPLKNENGSLALMYNGEIYNFVELRSQLESRGHVFRSGSDGEVLVHLYEERGEAALELVSGMFAAALWDSRKQCLLLARDRMGEKPLYLYEDGERLWFASEMKSLLSTGRVPFEIDPASADAYFHFQYVPEPATAIAGVRKLPAGHWLRVDVASWHLTQHRYWNMESVPEISGEPAEVVREQLKTITRQIVRADVPIGVALSGGLDSSAVAALAAKECGGELHAFTVGYRGSPESDERQDARALADYLGLRFHECELDDDEVVSTFAELVASRDDPIADIAGAGYLAVARRARDENVPVLLQGQGGDELFWGYPWVRDSVEQSARKELDPLWSPIPSAATGRQGRLSRFLPSFLRRSNSFPIEARSARSLQDRLVFLDLSPDFQWAERHLWSLYTSDMRDRLGEGCADAIFTFARPWPRLDLRITRLICETYLLQNGLAQGDRLSMAASVELRLPLVDHRLVETVMGLRKKRPDHRDPPKALFRKALEGLLPRWVMERPKRGFVPPVLRWHKGIFARNGEMLVDGELVRSSVLNPEAARLLSRGAFPHGTVAPMSFKALNFEIWAQVMRAIVKESSGATHGNCQAMVTSTSPASPRVRVERELAPVALFAYRRPKHLERTLTALARDPLASRTRLIVFCDGPGADSVKSAVEQVRAVVRSRNWCGEVEHHFFETNRGLSGSIKSGVSAVVERYGRVIVLEDDLIVSPSFLGYMNDALDRYEHEGRVMQVSATSLIDGAQSPFFLPWTTSWGWGTWQRSWRLMDAYPTGLEELEANEALRTKFDLDGAYPYTAMLRAEREGKVSSWAIRWYLSTFLSQGLVLYPNVSLAKNIGFDGSGEHCGSSDGFVMKTDGQVSTKWPSLISADPELCETWKQRLRSVRVDRTSLVGRLSQAMHRVVGSAVRKREAAA